MLTDISFLPLTFFNEGLVAEKKLKQLEFCKVKVSEREILRS